MSIVIEYYPENASKEDLTEFFKQENFQKCNYFLKPFPKGTTYLSWFEQKDYKSIDGLEAVIYPDKENSKKGWSVFTRTRVWASAYDKQKQNEVIKKLRKQFGGHFYNDSAGKNRFIKIDNSEFMTPSESGVFQVYERVKSQLSKLNYAINDHKEQDYLENNKNAHKDIVNIIKENLPSLALYNSLVPFLISALEHFFRELFVVLVEFDSFGKEEIKKVKLKDTREFNTIEDIFNINNELTKLEREIAKGYNFQNLDRINETFKRFLKIDIRAILSIKKKVVGKKAFLATELEELIERRHWIIHHFGFSSDTDKEKYIYFLNLTNCIIDTIIEFLEQQKKMKITDNSIYYGTTL
jgi:hypothetical protein